MPFGHYDEPEVLSYAIPLICSIGADVGQPIFTKANDQAVAFAHLDCDLYSSTMVIFEELGDRLRPGTVLVFDEYPGEEYQAFKEFTSANGLEFKYLSCDLNGISLSLVIQ